MSIQQQPAQQIHFQFRQHWKLLCPARRIDIMASDASQSLERPGLLQQLIQQRPPFTQATLNLLWLWNLKHPPRPLQVQV